MNRDINNINFNNNSDEISISDYDSNADSI